MGGAELKSVATSALSATRHLFSQDRQSEPRGRASVCAATGEWDRARVCVSTFDENPFTSRPMGRYDRGTEGHRADMTTH
jgi:hypothetical protein